MRKQTLANAERYITPELKEYEEKITGAEEKILAIETGVVRKVVAGTAGLYCAHAGERKHAGHA